MDDLGRELGGLDVNERDERGQTALHIAVTRNDLALVELLLSRGADARARTRPSARAPSPECDCAGEKKTCFHVADEYGNEMRGGECLEQNGLHLAAKHGSLELVKLILAASRGVDEVAGDGSTALHFATQNVTGPDEDVRVSELLLRSGADIEARNNEEKTALYLAVKFDKVTLARYLVSMGASVNVVTKNRSSPLYSALINSNAELVEFLLGEKAATDVRNGHDEDPLFFVLRVGDRGAGRSGLVRLLLESGIDPATRNRHGSTALHLAVQERDEELAELLVRRGCPIDPKDSHDFTPLSIAVCMNLEGMTRLLLRLGANPNDFVRSSSILELAIIRRKEPMVKLLLEFHADVNVGSERNKPVAAACLHKSTRIMQMLIDKGADINYKDKRGRTPLMRTIKEPNYAMMRHLLARGATINDRDHEGNTAFHILFENSSHTKENIIEYLLDKGADVNIENGSGSTPFRHMMFKCFTKGEVYVFIKRIALLLARNLHVNPKNLQYIRCDNTWQEYLNSCLLELSRMKELRICDNKCSYLEVITKSYSSLAPLLLDEGVVAGFDLQIRNNKFVNYSDILTRNFYEKKNRLSFVKQSVQVLNGIFQFKLPPEIVENICLYLSNKDMRKYLAITNQ